MVIADDGNNTERLNARGSHVERGRGAAVAEHHERMGVRIQVLDANVVLANFVFERGLALAGRIVRAVASLVVGAVTVDVHVGQLAGVAGDENGIGDVAAVCKGWGAAVCRREAGGELVAACFGLRWEKGSFSM